MTLLRLRCLRCGEYDEMDPNETYGWGLCSACWSKHPPPTIPRRGTLDSGPFYRWMDRWQKGMDRHPTYKALSAALDALESTP